MPVVLKARYAACDCVRRVIPISARHARRDCVRRVAPHHSPSCRRGSVRHVIPPNARYAGVIPCWGGRRMLAARGRRRPARRTHRSSRPLRAQDRSVFHTVATVRSRPAELHRWAGRPRTWLPEAVDWASRFMPRRSAGSVTRAVPGVLAIMPRRTADSRTRDHACGARDHAWSTGTHASAVGRFGRAVDAWVLEIMPRQSVDSDVRWMPGVLAIMPRRSVWGSLAAACPAQPAVPADRPCRCAQDRWFFADQLNRSIDVILAGAAS